MLSDAERISISPAPIRCMGHGASECAAAAGDASQGARNERSSTDAIDCRITPIIYVELRNMSAGAGSLLSKGVLVESEAILDSHSTLFGMNM